MDCDNVADTVRVQLLDDVPGERGVERMRQTGRKHLTQFLPVDRIITRHGVWLVANELRPDRLRSLKIDLLVCSIPWNAHKQLEAVALDIGVCPLNWVPSHRDLIEGIGKLEASVPINTARDATTRLEELGDVLVLRDGLQERDGGARDVPLLRAFPPPRADLLGVLPLAEDGPGRRRAIEDAHPELLYQQDELRISRTHVVRPGACNVEESRPMFPGVAGKVQVEGLLARDVLQVLEPEEN